MGKLAQQFRDAARSGVYRVRDAGIPRATAAAAQSCRESGRPFFAVLGDPDACLALPPLCHQRASS